MSTPTPTPTPTPSPSAPAQTQPENPPQPGEPPERPGYDITTPGGKPPIDNGDGTKTFQNGGEVIIPGNGGEKGSEKGVGKGGLTIGVPPGAVIDGSGGIIFPEGSGGGTITNSHGNTFYIPEGAVFFLDDFMPLGYNITIYNPFEDVFENDWFFDNVLFAYGHGLMIGTYTTPMLFSPNAPTTRAMIVTVLYRMAGSPCVEGLGNPFDDVAEGAWYTDAVKWAAENIIVYGFGGNFNPNAPINRQDLVVIFMRYAVHMGIKLPMARSYSRFIDDADIASYAREAIERFFRANIVSGYLDGSFKPQGEATRAEVAAMMQKFIEAMG